MTNHVHLVLSPQREGNAISALIRRLSARQTRYVNRLEGRCGTLWSGRFIRNAVQRNPLTGGRRFVDEIERRTGLRVEARSQGRPPGK